MDKYIRILTLLFTLNFNSFSQINQDSLEYMNLAGEARVFFKEAKYQQSHDSYLKAFSIKNTKPWKNDLLEMAKASILCKCDEPDKFLKLEIKYFDFFNVSKIEKDTTFLQIRNDKKFVKILRKSTINLSFAKSQISPESIAMLEKIYFDDQKDREDWKEIEKRFDWKSNEYKQMMSLVMKNDSDRVFKVLDFVQKNNGIPRDEIISNEASSGIFLSIQHSAFPIQQQFYPYIRKSLEFGGFRLSEFALFEDRYRLRQNLKQLYGTQLARSENGWHLQEIEDPKGLHQRRKIMGLPPINDYLKKWNLAYEEQKD